MRKGISIRIKAAILLLVFAFNSAVGFACALGLDMGFNSKHHHDEEVTNPSVHVHADGKKHTHHNKSSHHHDENKNDEKGGCCNDSVIKISQADKSVPQSFGISNPVFFTAFTFAYYDLDLLFPSQVSTSIKYFVRSHHPPIPDIRIAIQSFQI